MYVANSGSDNISAFQADLNTGLLTGVPGSPFASRVFPKSVAADPTGRFLYVANTGGRDGTASDINLTAFKIDANTGALSAIGVPLLVRGRPGDLAVDPTGKFLFMGNFTLNQISVFVIDANTGVLAEAVGSPFATGVSDISAAPIHLALDATGRRLFAAVNFNVVGFRVDPATGALVPVPGSPFTPALTPFNLAVSRTGDFLFVTDVNTSAVTTLRIDAATGALLPPAATTTVQTGFSPVAVTGDPTGNFVLVANAGTNSVSVFRLDRATGLLTPVASAFPAGGGPAALAFDPAGKFVYVANGLTNDVSTLTMDATTGALVATGAPVPAGSNPAAIAVVRVQTTSPAR